MSDSFVEKCKPVLITDEPNYLTGLQKSQGINNKIIKNNIPTAKRLWGYKF